MSCRVVCVVAVAGRLFSHVDVCAMLAVARAGIMLRTPPISENAPKDKDEVIHPRASEDRALN